ncbi:MAG: hypothetical protein IH940_10960 [Acidobacteria bacterium]|nr:hypothetical protein [Acidobacteriota bacterium]
MVALLALVFVAIAPLADTTQDGQQADADHDWVLPTDGAAPFRCRISGAVTYVI